tara:strand:- start:778 stop:1572 length:795 start_codon:yes stop_codon:yes gene_type:complete
MTELNQILNALPWPAFIVRPDLRVGKFNSAAQSMFGLIGSDVPLVNVIRHPSVLKAVEMSITTQIDHQARYLRRQIEGETAFKVHIRPVHPATGVMVCFENVDAAELQEQQRRDFVANVSHELRSPLTAIMGLLETLRGPALSDPKAQELLARIKLQLKRVRPATTGVELRHGDLQIDTAAQRVWRADHEIALGRREYALLLALIERPGKVFERGYLLDQVWGRNMDVETRTVDVHIARVRKALVQFGGETRIRTVRGSGYSME